MHPNHNATEKHYSNLAMHLLSKTDIQQWFRLAAF